MSDITDTRDFRKLMDTVGILRTHYSNLSKKAEEQMLVARMKGDMTTANKYSQTLASMDDNYRAALKKIGDEITTTNQLKATRKVIRDAATEAHGFLKRLEDFVLTVAELEKAAKFIGQIATNIARIL